MKTRGGASDVPGAWVDVSRADVLREAEGCQPWARFSRELWPAPPFRSVSPLLPSTDPRTPCLRAFRISGSGVLKKAGRSREQDSPSSSSFLSFFPPSLPPSPPSFTKFNSYLPSSFYVSKVGERIFFSFSVKALKNESSQKPEAVPLGWNCGWGSRGGLACGQTRQTQALGWVPKQAQI